MEVNMTMTTIELLFGIGGMVALVALTSVWIIKINAWIKQLDMEIGDANEVF